MDVSGVRFPPGAKYISPDMSLAEIAKSLKHCCKFFSQLEQDQEEEKKIYSPFCMYIAGSEFTTELTDSNSRIHLGCIYADIFRLHAPDNPFPAERTKDILIFLAGQLSHLQNAKSPFFSKAYHILDNISTVKSYNICLDMDSRSADEVFTELFRVLFGVVNSAQDVQLKVRMLDVMASILLDSDFVSQKLMYLILECLLEKSKRMNRAAYELSRDLLRKTSSNMEESVLVFFQNALLSENSEKDILTRNWPMLLSELYKILNNFFMNMVPQLELKLRTDNLDERKQVVKLLGQMFSEKGSELAVQYPTLWTSFLARSNDIEAAIRADCVNFCSDMIINHSKDDEKSMEMVNRLIEVMKLRRHDTDEGVRTAVVIAIRAVAMHDLKLLSEELVGFLSERLMDKKHKVRETAVRAVADVYKKALSEKNNLAAVYRNRFQPLQSQLLRVYYTQSFSDCILLERIFVSSMVRYSLPNSERMQRFLELFCSVDNLAIKALDQMFKHQKVLRGLLNNMLQCLLSNDKTKANGALWDTIRSISSYLQSPVQAREHMKKFISVARDDKNIFQWLKYLAGKDYVCQKVALAVRDILKRLEVLGINRAIRQTVQQFLERLVLVTILVDSSSFFILVGLVQEDLNSSLKSNDKKTRGVDLLCMLAKNDPHLFTSNDCFEIIIGMLRGKDECIVEKSLLILLSTASVIEEKFETVRTILFPELKAIAKTATPYQAKYAVKIMNSFSSVREKPLMQVYKESKDWAVENAVPGLKLRTVLTTLGCIAEFLPSQAGKDIKGFIAAIVVKKIIMQSRRKPSRKKEAKWCSKNELSEETATKLVAMKCMVRWLCGLKSNDSDCCGSTLRLLQHMMHNVGDLMKCGQILKADMAHLRLQAAICILKIARCDVYREMISHSILTEFAVLLMDEVREVRQLLLNKLYKDLFSFKIHVSFLSLFWVIPQEKLKEHRDHGATLYRQLVLRFRAVSKEKKVSWAMPEYAISFVIHLLANDPEVPVMEDIPMSVLSRVKDSVNFMLEPLLTREHPESFGFIKRLAELIKRTKLQGGPENELRSRTLYKVCDLVLQAVLSKSAQYAVGIIEPPDSAMKKFLPTRLYNHLDANENDQNYLPEAFKIENKRVPVANEKQVYRNPPQKVTSKFPRKVVAVTKVAITQSLDNSPAQTNSIRSSLSEVNRPSPASDCVPRKRVSDTDSDDETLAVKKAKLDGRRKTSGRRTKKDSGRKVEERKEFAELQTENEKSGSDTSRSSPSSRPKRAAAGRKMFDYLKSAKKTPTKTGQVS